MSTGHQGQKIMYTTLFMGKVCRKNPDFDKDKTDVMFGLTLYDFASFIFLYVKGIKFLLKIKLWASFTKAWSPCVILFFLFSLFISLFFFQDDSLEHRSFIGFLCKPKKIKPLSLPFYFPYHLCHHPEGTPGSCWGWTPEEDPLEKGMATHSSILAWRIPWTEEPGGLQTMGSQRDVGNLISGSSALSKSNLKIWKFMVHVLLKPGLEKVPSLLGK